MKSQAKSSTSGTRIEKDSMGEMTVPADALYGATAQRAVINFPVSGRPVPPAVIHAFALLKKAAAQVNGDLKKLESNHVKTIASASDEIAAAFKNGYDSPEALAMMAHFPIDIFQTGSGTSTNMNVNEVIVNLAKRSAGADQRSAKTSLH